MSFLDNYEDVAARIQRFWKAHPAGKIHTAIIEVFLKAGYILVECRVYREFEDVEPSGIDYAFGNVATYNVQMKKWFVEDTVTSAIGRAVGLVLGTDKRPTAQNMAQVERVDASIVKSSANDVDLWQTHFGAIPSYKSQEEVDAAGETGLAGAIAAVTAQIGTDTLKEAPSCSHGHRIWREGVSAKTGKAWANYSCVERKPNQCEPLWYVMGSSGKWSQQL